MVQTCKSQTLKGLLLLPRARACTGVVATHQSHHCESISAWRGASPLSRSSSVVCAARRTARASEPDSHPLLTITSPRSLHHRRIGRTSPRDHTQQTPHPRKGGRSFGRSTACTSLVPCCCWPAEPLARSALSSYANHRPVCLAPLAGPQRRPPRAPPHEHTLKCTHTHTRINTHTHARTETGAEAPSQTITDQPARSRARARQEGETLWHRRPPRTPQRASAAHSPLLLK